MLHKRQLLLLFALMLLFMGCSPSESDTARELIAADYPAVDGSTSAHPLQRFIACDILEVPCAWSEMSLDNVQRTILPAPEVDINDEKARFIESIVHNGTHGGYMSVIEGQADFALVARAPSEDELQAADELNVPLDVQPVALDAFVFLVNVDNPVESLEIETIRRIFTGEITTWTELGVTIDPDAEGDEKIHAYQRNRNSGSQELMESLVMGELVMIDAPEMITTSMLGPLNAIGGNAWDGNGDTLGLGYSVYFYANFMFPHEYVRLVPIEGVAPTSENIAARTYPLFAEVSAVVREDMPADSTAVILRDWLLTDDGQSVIEASGYVPIGSEK